MLADRGYDADWFRAALQRKGIKTCVPGRKSRTTTVKYDKKRYRRRNRIEIMFGRLKDWRAWSRDMIISNRHFLCDCLGCNRYLLASINET